MTLIVQARELTKRYRLGGRSEPYGQNLREMVIDTLRSPVKWLRGRLSSNNEILWALKDVSFDVREGEVVGVIGRNGAGKSTLLKILSRITKPTSGEVDLYGHVGSLLEVGTGFHPELTGRENIFLNGAILGMKRSYIEQRFDEIVAFAEIERFLDTPVKRYSSGMYVRLAFAVAAHLEPEILIVDEVLAVGDAQFQKKCLGKIGDVAKEGRTVLFVSHNMAAVKALCNRAMLLEAGSITHDGKVDEVVETYLMERDEIASSGVIPDDAKRTYGTGEAKLRAVSIADLDGEVVSQLYLGQPFRVTVIFDVLELIPEAIIEISIATVEGMQVTLSASDDEGRPPLRLSKGRQMITVEFNTVLLPRRYTLMLGIHRYADGTTIDWFERSLDFTVLNVAQTSEDRYRWSPTRGFMRPWASWSEPEPVYTEFAADEALANSNIGVNSATR